MALTPEDAQVIDTWADKELNIYEVLKRNCALRGMSIEESRSVSLALIQSIATSSMVGNSIAIAIREITKSSS